MKFNPLLYYSEPSGRRYDRGIMCVSISNNCIVRIVCQTFFYILSLWQCLGSTLAVWRFHVRSIYSTKIHVTLSCSIRTSSATNSEERARGKNPWRPTEGWELSSELKPILLPFSKPLSWACLFALGIALFHLLTTRNIICHNIPTHWAPKCPVLASPQILIGFSLFAPHFDGPKKIKKAWFLRGYAITVPWDDRGPTAGPGLGPLFGGALEVGRLRTGAGPTSAPKWWDFSRSTFVPSMFFLGFFLSTLSLSLALL